MAGRLVWPWWQRLMHWLLAGGVLLALATWQGGRWHERLGYLVLFMVVLRILLGAWGPVPLRFRSFVRAPGQTLDYARQVLGGHPQRHLNHNPLGAWMVLALLSLAGAAALSGWLYTTDRFWGVEWVIVAHALLAWPLLALAVLHLAGIALASWQHRENLILAMIHGRKREH